MGTPTVKLSLAAPPPAIEEREGAYFIAQSAIPLAAVILRFQEGLSPDTIRRECFPSLPLAHVYSAIAFYLNHQEEVDAWLTQLRQEEDALQEHLLIAHPEFVKTAEELRNRLLSVSPQ
ncbi:MAG: DUF433 domain-containing protein [Blastocatellia bacterium]|nr:DUF433 domain-containing protein [Blastocatellia bacterium]